MTTCPEARELMLEAPPHHLRGEGTSPLARHVRTCPDCDERAAFVLREQQALSEELASLCPDGGADRALARLRWARRGTPSASHVRGGSAKSEPRRAWWRGAGAVAVAAGLAAALLRWDPSPPPATPPDALPAPPAPVVEAPDRGQVTVFSTPDPAVTVVWIDQESSE